MNERFQRLRRIALRVLKHTIRPFLIVAIFIAIVLILIAGIQYIIDLDDAVYSDKDKDKKKNVPYNVEQYTSSVTIDSKGKIETAKTAKELWDEMLKNNSRVNEYLNRPEELLKMINAEIVTDYLDTRPDPSKPIDWGKINQNINSKEVQGIIKLRRAFEDGTNSLITYVDPDTFQSYIDKYNKTGSEADRKKALSYFTLEREYNTSNSGGTEGSGIIYGTGSFAKYTDLTEDQLRGIASQCKIEQGTLEGAAAEASLMANRFELYGSKYGTGGQGLYNYVRDSGWFSRSKEHLESKDAGDDYVEVVRAVLVNGKRTLPGYIDEHDCFADIKSSTNNGNAINIRERSEYVPHVTKIANNYSSSYIFYSYPTSTSDPFGYISEENRKKIGDFYYDYTTGQEVNKKSDNGSNQNTNQDMATDAVSTNKSIYAKVATWKEVTDTLESDDPSVLTNGPNGIKTYNMTTTKINYQDLVSGYKMPFDYLWSLLVVGQEKEFIFDLIDLVYNSEIEITVHDNLTKNTNISVDTYTKKIKEINNNIDVKGSNTYTTRHTIITKTNTLDIKVTKADVWIVNYLQEFTHQIPDTTKTTSQSEPYNEEYENRKVYITNTVESKKYVASPAKIVEKTDKQSEEPNFVTLFLKHRKFEGNIKSASDWLFEILEKGKNTVNMVDLTKYLLYKATGSSYGVGEFDFSSYNPENFKSVSSQYGGKSNIEGVPGQVYDFLLSKGVPPVGAAAILGNIEGESGFRTEATNGTHNGLCQWTISGRFKGLEALANSKGTTWTDVQIQLEFMWSELEGNYSSVKKVIMNATSEADMEYATWYFGRYYEVFFSNDNFETSKNETAKRYEYAQKWYKQWQESNTGSFTGDSINGGSYNFPHYLQKDYPGSYGDETIPTAGCGPTSLAMILAGLKNDSSINPQTVVANIKEYWPDGSYYVSNVGSSHCIFYSSFLQKYYGVTSEMYPSHESALEALDKGYPVIGGEDGHVLAIIPVSAQLKAQGYKFYILDSGRGHDGPYRSVAEAETVVRGNLRFTAIIKP